MSIATVTRTLTGHNPNASIESVAAIADTLGLHFMLSPKASATEIRGQQQALRQKRA